MLQIRVADPTILDPDVHLLGPDRREFVGEGLEWRVRRLGGVGVNCGHCV
jgi:hypothetical protein